MKRYDSTNTGKGLPIYAFLLTAVSLVYRAIGSTVNHPFWVDEFSTAKNARHMVEYGLGVFTRPGIIIERHNITTHALTALSFTLFGQTESAARIPFILIGSFLPVSIFFLTRKIAGTVAGVCASMLTLFSHFMITWSRQARGYVILNVAIAWTIYFYLSVMDKKTATRKNAAGLILFVVIGLLTHPLYYLLIIAIGLHWAIVKRIFLIQLIKDTHSYIAIIPLITVAIAIMYTQDALRFFTTPLFGANNVWYYHSFLWREYTLITFMGILGLVISLVKNKAQTSLILTYIGLHLLFINFFFGHYLTKYTLAIFPFLLIGTAVVITELSDLIIKTYLPKIKHKKYLLFIIPIGLTMFIVANGDKFVTKPKQYYSVNKDFREIANIDYHQIYAIVKTKGRLSENKTAVIDTWPDRAKWYVGNRYPSLYFFKWQNEPGRVSGHVRKTAFTTNKNGEKMTVGGERFKFVGELADLKLVMKTYPRGFIYIDDATLPKDVIDYAENNLKKELYLDHYPLDENPYSIWPATLYSWGV